VSSSQSGYDTLRVVLAKRVILVEGPSDELIVQRAYRDAHGCLPIEDGVDVINVRGLSFARFLDIAKPLGKRVGVLTDNDGREAAEVIATTMPTRMRRESQSTWANWPMALRSSHRLWRRAGELRSTRSWGRTTRMTSRFRTHMTGNKTSWALKVLEADDAVVMPGYIRDAVA
jgi:putative ATP-dependent endonuclease of OLD family